MQIPFNKPFLTGKEVKYLQEAVYVYTHISGNGFFTKQCHQFFENNYGFKKTLLTTSCTDALEMSALLMDIQPGDEVIVPSFTFVSTALAYVRQGANIVFADSRVDHPGIDEDEIESLITNRTKAIVVVHYAGVACDMDKIMGIARQYNLFVVEDAAQAIDSYYKGRPIGGIGHFGTFSFHETKNLQCGEGGLLIINDEKYTKRAEIIWEKGTNRAEFFRGEVNKYGWVDVGSSFLPSELNAAFLYAQLEQLEAIQQKRKNIWYAYFNALKILEEKKLVKLPYIPNYAANNAHMFYIVCNNYEERTALIKYLKEKGIMAVFHYLPLHKSSFYSKLYGKETLTKAEKYSDEILRLPFFHDLRPEEVEYITDIIKQFYL
ncbi:UDP-4-amino-4-deoxy-L-arabinose--oxoglutarate aminotransferase [Salinivirga cyanobacteriivorans]|uniref:UDP-4-amino-4-deoxy-L-arabinose--oxoglutarate aminotransferase n=1 Tax=Salinivirga cyanobacteriivorans TaxID=1307839 RepID=A0A0S2I015_9BACT|nr:dTDP-4-amino-4,6-dideoxygalactose transaminase [Salinivirga cyanobacteriivorans]ALO15607.1 UDP-4-amino-4-deoxy-L-arabinose--oxoglutarate aminotransferase [Salinivirga cyanobacteriivorans]